MIKEMEKEDGINRRKNIVKDPKVISADDDTETR